MTDNDEQKSDLKMEEKLAAKLKKYCSREGKELEPKKSAIIFHKLGLIYKNRSPDKIALIQGAALLNAAIVRNPENVEEIKQDLKIFCDDLLITANAQFKCADLVALSSQIKQEIIQMRQKTEELLANLPFIPMKISDQEFSVAKKNKIESMASLQSKITEDFKKIMRKVAWISKSIMGKPPCEFALVGLGSLVRKEVTPYSDFESIIILEEGVQHRILHEKVLEYFRWFSVVFQVVLINLGETILPCVNISSLSGFYDENTPRGISSDGMVPYACKTPLGRPFVTQNKPFTLELIQPVSIMANFTDLDQDLKNGYHLADMLKSTSFVAGNPSIYHYFEKQIWQKIQLSSPNEEGVFSPIYNQLENNKNQLSATFLMISGKMEMSVKNIFYRTSTLFIAALGKIYKIRENSCFEIVDKLYELQKISAIDKLNLKFAVAVACETRLQFYTKKKSQFDLTKYTSDTDGVLKLCGERSIVEYIAITTTIQNNILQKQMDFTLKPNVMLKAYYNLQLYDEAVAWNNSHLHEYENLSDEEKGIAYRFLGMCKHRMEKYEDATTDLVKAKQIFRPVTVAPCIALLQTLACQYYCFFSNNQHGILQKTVDKLMPEMVGDIVDKMEIKPLQKIRKIDLQKPILKNILHQSGFKEMFPFLNPIVERVENTSLLDIQRFLTDKIEEKNDKLAGFLYAYSKVYDIIKQLNYHDLIDTLADIPGAVNTGEDFKKYLSYLKPVIVFFINEEVFSEIPPATSEAIVEYFRHIKDPKPIDIGDIAAEIEPLLD